MHYFAARSALEFAQCYRLDAMNYWGLNDPVHDHYGGVKGKQSAEQAAETDRLRTKLNQGYPRIRHLAVTFRIASAYGYPVQSIMQGVTGDFLHEVSSPKPANRAEALRVIDQIVGAVAQERDRARGHILGPWWWIIDALGLVLRTPFLILRAAGLPLAYEQTVWGQGVKVAELLVLALLGGWLGADLIR